MSEYQSELNAIVRAIKAISAEQGAILTKELKQIRDHRKLAEETAQLHRQQEAEARYKQEEIWRENRKNKSKQYE